LLSPAMRSPSRRWNASSTASFTSFVSAGSGVWLSKGRMATVLMLGRPPPAKPYRQPLSATASALPAPAPNRRIEHRSRIDQDHRKLKPSPLLRKIHAGAGRHPLGVELGAAAGQHLALASPLCLEHAPAAARLVVLILPPEPDRRVARRQRAPTPGDGGVPIHGSRRLRHQRCGPARATGQQHTGGNVGEYDPRVKRKMLRSQELNLMTIAGMSVLEIHRIRNRLEQGDDMIRHTPERVLVG